MVVVAGRQQEGHDILARRDDPLQLEVDVRGDFRHSSQIERVRGDQQLDDRPVRIE
jgi:hypothetical protein